MAEENIDQEIRTCDNCGKPVGPALVRFLDVQVAMVQCAAIQERAGLSLMLGSAALADVFASHSSLTKIAHELKHRLFLCESCYCGELCLAELVEKVVVRLSKEKVTA